jgi:hypothetical protein
MFTLEINEYAMLNRQFLVGEALVHIWELNNYTDNIQPMRQQMYAQIMGWA